MELTNAETRMFNTVQKIADATTDSISKTLGYTNAGALYILKKLENKGVLTSRKIGRKLEWFVNGEEAHRELTDDVPPPHYEREPVEAVAPPPKATVGREAMLDELIQASLQMHQLDEELRLRREALEEKMRNLRAQLLVTVLPARGAPRQYIARSTKSVLVAQVAKLIETIGPLTIHEVADRLDLKSNQARGVVANMLRNKLARRRDEDGRYELTSNGAAA